MRALRLKRRAVGRHKRMYRVIGQLLVACLVAVACSPEGDQPAAPQLPDHLAELKTFDPSSPDVRPNPPMDRSMVGCYSVALDPAHERLQPPKVIELTAEPAGEFGFHQLYVVKVDAKRSKDWTWRPYTADEIRLNIGNSFRGWGMSLRSVPSGFDGDAFWVSDSMERYEALAQIRRIACR